MYPFNTEQVLFEEDSTGNKCIIQYTLTFLIVTFANNGIPLTPTNLEVILLSGRSTNSNIV